MHSMDCLARLNRRKLFFSHGYVICAFIYGPSDQTAGYGNETIRLASEKVSAVRNNSFPLPCKTGVTICRDSDRWLMKNYIKIESHG